MLEKFVMSCNECVAVLNFEERRDQTIEKRQRSQGDSPRPEEAVAAGVVGGSHPEAKMAEENEKKRWRQPLVGAEGERHLRTPSCGGNVHYIFREEREDIISVVILPNRFLGR